MRSLPVLVYESECDKFKLIFSPHKVSYREGCGGSMRDVVAQ